MPPNPEGVPSRARLPRPAWGLSSLNSLRNNNCRQLISLKSNTIVALAYDANRSPVGIMAIKVP